MNRLIISFLFLVCALVLRAQELTVVSMQPTMEVITADKQRKDLNGNVCAVVYVQALNPNLKFQGNVIGDVSFDSSQYVVYLSPGTKTLKILGDTFFPKTVQFADYGIDAVESKRVYTLQITTPAANGGGSVDLGENYVTFTVVPENAAIVIDGGDPEVFDNGEWRRRLPYGQHSYRITATGYKPESGTISVTKGEPVQKSVKLQSLMAQLSVKCSTQDAQIYINDEKMGTGSYTGSLPAGRYVVEARHPNYVTYSEVVTLEESSTKTLNIPALTALTGTLDIDYSPTGTLIQIDGTDYGTSPRLVYDLLVGNHDVTLSKDGYETATTAVTINKGEITSLKGTLNKQEKNNTTNSELANLSPKEINNLGWKYHQEGNYSKAVECYKVAADKGNARAQNNLGWCYANGKGVQQDYSKAIEWYRKSAEKGDGLAQNNLGWSYANGKGVQQDWSKAIEWYRKAADKGEELAQCNLGLCYEKGQSVPQDWSKAVEWYRKAADQGYAEAQCNLGWCYENGKGVLQDWSKAVEWYRKAADQGFARAQNNLGLCYEKGQSVLQDWSKAVEWYRKAADQGNAIAQCNLGWCYENGKGVLQDWSKAVEWYRKAADQGFARAQNNLGLCYEKGQSVLQDWSKAVEWYRKAADQGNAIAQCNLGLCYQYGKGVDKDISKAIEWYQKAADQGNERAINKLKELQK